MSKKNNSKRPLAILLCILCLFGCLPVTAFADPGEGQQATSQYGSEIIGSDGNTYNSVIGYITMTYHDDGTTSYATHNGGRAYRYFQLIHSDNSVENAYCIEGGVSFDADNSYTSVNQNNNYYFQQLPPVARNGIILTALYGMQPGKTSPVSDTNTADYQMATQVIIWEYQQQLRTSPTTLVDNGPIDSHQFYKIIQGRPAEQCYNWILQQIAGHATIPSFTGHNLSTAPTHTLKYNPATKLYSLTLTDTNNLGVDFEELESFPELTVSRSGNTYTLTSTKMIETAVACKFRKDIPIMGAQLIWGYPGKQTMMTGSEDPVIFYMLINTETYGIGRIFKSSEDGKVDGVTFTITGTDVNKTVTTGANGQVDVELMPGTYTVTEQPIDRYVMPASQTITIESGQTSPIYFSNILKKFRAGVTKRDSETGYSQGDASLAGAVYGIYKNGVLVNTYTTDSNGGFTTAEYACDTDWTIKEISPSEGYLLDTAIHKVGAAPGLFTVAHNLVSNDVTEDVIKGRIWLIKHTDEGETGIETPESGAEFEIYLASAGSYADARNAEKDYLITDADGICQSKELPYGRYVVHQTVGWEGKEKIDDFVVYIKEDGKIYSFILNNAPYRALVEIVKKDIETGRIIPYEGIAFQVRDLTTGELIVQHINYPAPVDIDTYYTSTEGRLMMPEKLPWTENGYELIEVATAYGYVLDSDPVWFNVDPENGNAVVVVEKHNIAQKGRIVITKTGEVFSSVQENDGYYQPVYEVKGLPGAVYAVYAEEDIITGDGTVRANKGDLVCRVETGSDGIGTSDLLYLGQYRIVEETAPYGMIISKEIQTVELTYAGQEIEVTQTESSFYNERQRIRIDLLKMLERDEKFGIGNNDEYQKVSFGLYAAEDITAADGSRIPADGLIETVSLTEELTAVFAADLPVDAKYYVQERSTDSCYILSDARYPVDFTYQGQDAGVYKISLGTEKPIENKLIRGSIEGLKTGEKADPLEGAVFGLFCPDTTEFTEENALITATSDSDGSFKFEDIPCGHWIVRELSAPKAYVHSDDLHHVYITADGERIKITAENRLIRGTVQLTKVDAAYPDNKLTGAVFEVYEDTNGSKVLDKDDVLIGEMTEISEGVYTMENLVYNGYLLQEKQAPEGFELDEGEYYFEIREDGETVIVENQAGVGFINKAQKGVLKIIKTSSDGQIEGFSFRIEGTAAGGISYSEVFKTDANGIIAAELRVGEYTVSEVADDMSKRYVLPSDQVVEIFAGESLEVSFYNVIKDTPKTGDDRNLTLWIVLLVLSLVGGGVTFWVNRRRKHKHK